MPAVNDAQLPESVLTEAASGLAEVATEFADEIGGPPTLAEFLEVLGWAIPTNSDVVADSFPEPVSLRANLKGNKRYSSAEKSRVGELNDNVFEEARDHLLTLFRQLNSVTGAQVTPDDFAAAVLQALNTDRITLADVTGSDVRKIAADVPKKRAAKAEVGDILAIPVQGGNRLGVVLTRNRFGTALGLFEGVSANGRLTAELRKAPRKLPVYTEDSLVKNGTWQIVGHDESLLAEFPTEPEIYHKPGAWPGIDTGEHGAAEPADGPLRLIGADEAREVGLADGSYRQTYAAAFLQKRLTDETS
jgi:hypothetical protein